MVPHTREEFTDAVLDLLAERLGNNAPFPGDWAHAFAELKEWAEMTEGHGDGECVSREDHDKELVEAREEGKALDVKAATTELKAERDTALAEAKAATTELERVERLSPITAGEVMAIALKAAVAIRREAEHIRTSKRLSKDGAATRLDWAADKLEEVSK